MAKATKVKRGVYVERDEPWNSCVVVVPQKVTVIEPAVFILDDNFEATQAVLFRDFNRPTRPMLVKPLKEFLAKFKWVGRLKTIVKTTEEVW